LQKETDQILGDALPGRILSDAFGQILGVTQKPGVTQNPGIAQNSAEGVICASANQ